MSLFGWCAIGIVVSFCVIAFLRIAVIHRNQLNLLQIIYKQIEMIEYLDKEQNKLKKIVKKEKK